MVPRHVRPGWERGRREPARLRALPERDQVASLSPRSPPADLLTPLDRPTAAHSARSPTTIQEGKTAPSCRRRKAGRMWTGGLDVPGLPEAGRPSRCGQVTRRPFSVQGNHLHLLIEAQDNRALAEGMQGLSVRLARGLNRLMGRHGKVLADRFHAHVLRTPAETRRAIAYVLLNHRSHAARSGERVGRGSRTRSRRRGSSTGGRGQRNRPRRPLLPPRRTLGCSRPGGRGTVWWQRTKPQRERRPRISPRECAGGVPYEMR